jgi:hypothetical protein
MLLAVRTQAEHDRAQLAQEWQARDQARSSPPPADASSKAIPPAVKTATLPKPPEAPRKLLRVRLHTRYTAQVTVDGRFLGENTIFEVELTAGEHRALVHSPCCADNQQTFVVRENHPEMYPLRFGSPYPARLKAMNAPTDAQVMIDGAFLGTAGDLPDYSMTEPAKIVTVTIGDRTMKKTLIAGRTNELDYAKAAGK